MQACHASILKNVMKINFWVKNAKKLVRNVHYSAETGNIFAFYTLYSAKVTMFFHLCRTVQRMLIFLLAEQRNWLWYIYSTVYCILRNFFVLLWHFSGFHFLSPGWWEYMKNVYCVHRRWWWWAMSTCLPGWWEYMINVYCIHRR